MLHGLLHYCRVTGTVGDKKTIVVLASKGWKIIVPWADHDLYASLQEAPQLVVLQSNIQAQYAYRSTRGVFQDI